MNLRVLYVIAGFSLVLASCKKKQYPEPETDPVNQPVFYFQGTVNGTPVNLQAGINDYYMHADYTIDGNNVCNFTGTIDQLLPLSSQEKLEVIIKDSRTMTGYSISNADSTLSVSNYLYKVGVPAVGCRLYCTALMNMPASSYQWDFGDGTISPSTREQNVRHIFKSSTGNNIYNVQLTGYSGTSSSTVARNVKFPGSGSCFVTINQIQTTSTPNQFVFYGFQQRGLGVVTYTWDYGDGNTSTGLNGNHTYSTAGIYQVKLSSVDGAGDSTVDNCNIAVGGAPGCVTNFSCTMESPVATNPYALENVIIRWTDANGIVYTSDNAGQLNNAYFDVESVEEYHLNEHNDPTKKMKVRFKCLVFNGSNSILIDNAEAIIAVAYKK